ncbi:hypothetical protein [Frigidibacter sp. SD6-1]|uniref:hypothetical protein n=1 Tax=Frigidibacter sp. SD6-1 TaxID=3032581 RepID=UPI0024DFBFA3|nr:hypothetical protein [Frigidibacter sp. SD6-1]
MASALTEISHQNEKLQMLLAPAKKIFDETFPDHSRRLHAARSDKERMAICEELRTHAFAEYRKLTGSDPTGGGVYSLLPSQFTTLTTQSGDDLINTMTTMVNSLAFIKDMQDETQISVQMYNAGCYLMTAAGFTAMFATAAITIGSATAVVEAGVAGIAAAGGAGPVVALVVAIVVAVLVPFLYFMLKPAYIMSFVVNNTSQKLKWVDHYEVHGKISGWTDEINPAIAIPQTNGVTAVYRTLGIVTGQKKDMALVGCQLGFRYSYENGATTTPKVAFGTESPLTSISVDNNVWTEFDVSAEQVAEDTDSHNAMSSQATSGALTSTINCAKASGDGAFSVAVVGDGTIAA